MQAVLYLERDSSTAKRIIVHNANAGVRPLPIFTTNIPAAHMTRHNKLRMYSLLFSVSYWLLVAFYFVAVRYGGLGEYAPPDLYYADLAAYAAIVGVSIGLLFGLLPLNKLLRLQQRRSFLHVVLIGTSCYILFFIAVIFAASLYGNTLPFAFSYIFSANGLIVLFHLSICSLLYHFILQINKKFGPGVLLKYTVGRYFAPKVENRAFMFLDLKSSTELAEKLEHVAYSRLVQDCYAELTVPLIQYNAEIYQYVGDEVVLTWQINPFFSAAHCHQLLFAFQQRLEAKKDYFLANYGACPHFKAGAHCGNVTVAEVGEIKTEIAYHGDVLNTASRIQSLCNKFNQQLLLSESLVALLPEKDRIKTVFITEEALRGKETPTKIFTIAPPGR